MLDLINDFSPGLFFMQALILIILIVLMRKFAWKPILNALSEREEGIAEALAAAENAKIEMANLEASNQAAAQEARAQRDEMLKDAREIKEKMIADAAGQAQEKADKIIAQAQEAIEAEKKAALADIKSQVADLSVDIAEKVTRKELSQKDAQHALIEQLLAEANI
ncbi:MULTISPECIES: F0F1 ATP synthase subunit B [Nonlabens]|uniref:ATP synthase subunit b n=1 Tax=Nonlabens ulvanivorans TaxID=906888 RepID=A0A081D6V0_NONUL|nr:F0F1 ATP synthase subunit B [Nonlabens ulvanivorans]KEZ92536.1 ATP F0F1 synthase subunit B [Nonlabens ulvanivorans]PRX15374.1 ATP synthase F0 subcomplex B subunit [Nonlabens ulvanivorans]WOI22276.1 F0F1 ATP synthase subunit B [Nonlabens ulvanivorans]GAK74646.1 ATP synthase B chain [Nonlabens ulvanivorans]GAK98516.1 ATP synthase F0 sector subunit b [Nonlabens ulvanivorans]